MSAGRALNARQIAFADAWCGAGSGVSAARAAGYTGTPKALGITASRLLQHPGIVARIEDRYGRPLSELRGRLAPPAAIDARVDALVDACHDTAGPQLELGLEEHASPVSLTPGEGRGTGTERVAILMGLARNPRTPGSVKIAAIKLAAHLEGDGTQGRGVHRAPVLTAPPTPTPVATRPRLQLVLSGSDARRHRPKDDEDEP